MVTKTFFAVLVLAEFSLIMLLSAISSAIMLKNLYLIQGLHKQSSVFHKGMSPTWIVYLVELFVLSAVMCVGAAIMVVNWSSDGYSDPELIFWAGVVGGCLIPATPVSVLFLSLDRLVIIACPVRFYTHRVKCMFAGTSALLTLLLAVSYFQLVFTTKQCDAFPHNDCWSFACFSSSTSVFFYAIDRFVVAVPNFFISLAFLMCLFKKRLRTDHSHRRKLGDRIALLALVFSFIFDLLPSTINLVFTYATNENLSDKIGPYKQLTSSMNALSYALVNIKILLTLTKDSISSSCYNKMPNRKSFSAMLVTKK